MDFLNSTFKMGRLFGIDIYIHILFILWSGFRLVQAGQGFLNELVFILMIYTIVLIHEYGHCLGARWVGGDAHRILLWPLGGIAYPTAPMRPWPQFVTIAAGPIVHPIFCLISGAFVAFQVGGFNLLWLSPFHGIPLGFSANQPELLGFAAMFYNVNLWLLAFNLMPIFPLDGGQMLRSILWPYMGLNKATVLSCQIGLVGAVGFAILGISNGGFILVAIALMAGMTCYQHLQAARYGNLWQDDVYTATALQSQADSKPLLERLFKIKVKRNPRDTGSTKKTGVVNPNPGGWEAKQAEQAKREEEVDRILKKVKESGINSLSYIEQQTLINATEQRKADERDFQKRTRS